MAENSIARDLLILADENNSATSEKTIVRPNTTLDQVYDQLSPDYKTLREILEGIYAQPHTHLLASLLGRKRGKEAAR